MAVYGSLPNIGIVISKKILMTMKKIALLFIFTVQFANSQFLLPAKTPESVGFSTDRLKQIDRVFQEYIDKKYQAGIMAMVVRDGQIVYYKALGYDDFETKTPLQRDGIVRIASQTKAITSTAVMMLYEEGRFLLDDPISKYIPSFKDPKVIDKFNEKDTTFTSVAAKREITIRDLLTHTSGIGYPGIGSAEAKALYAKYKIPSGIGTPNDKLSDVINALAALPLMHNPGEKWTYGLNIDVLGYLVEVVSGKTLGDFLQQRIFEPLGMKDTYFYLPAAKHDRLTTLYAEFNKITIKMPKNIPSVDFPKVNGSFYSGGAGLVSTAYDYAIFLQMLLNGGRYNGKMLLSPTTIATMTHNQIGDLNVGVRKFGLGFALGTAREAARLPPSARMFEWGGIFGTTYWVDPQQNLTAILITQKYPNSYNDLNDKFKVLVYQAIERMNPN